jgi:hypothetical protein
VQLTFRKPETEIKVASSNIIYGEDHVGKTSLAADPKLNVLFLNLMETSVDTVLAGCSNVTIQDVRSYREMEEICKFLVSDSKELKQFNSLFMDSYTKLQDMVKDHVALEYAANRAREIKGRFGAMSDWGDLQDKIIGLTKFLHNSVSKNAKHPMHVFMVGHAVEDKDVATGATRVSVNLQGKQAGPVCMSSVDNVFYMAKKETEEGTKRFLLTDANGKFRAGHRTSVNAKKLPLYIENPKLSEVLEALGYKF